MAKLTIKPSLMAGISGTLLQWYDFSLFGFFAPIIAAHYFPANNHIAAILSTFGIFAVGYLLSPLGAIFFGHIGDRQGRKYALQLSILLMALPTALMAILPTYQQIGLWAPILLTLLRLVQGFVASAEFAGSAVFMAEHASANNRYLMGCLTSCSYSAGSLLGAMVASFCTAAFMPSWGWRLAFALALIGIFLIYYLRTQVAETPAFIDEVKRPKNIQAAPLLKALTQSTRSVLVTIGVSCCIGVISFGTYVYMVTYLHQMNHLSLSQAVFIVSMGLITDIIFEPTFAILADKIGGQKVYRWGSFLMILAIVPIFYGFNSPSMIVNLIAMVIMSILIAMTFAPTNTLLAYLFKPEHRYSGFAVSFNIGIALFGGTAPLALAALATHCHSSLALSGYFIMAILIGLWAMKWANKPC